MACIEISDRGLRLRMTDIFNSVFDSLKKKEIKCNCVCCKHGGIGLQAIALRQFANERGSKTMQMRE